MKRLFNLLLLLMTISSAYAEGDGIIVTYQGARTSYRFDEMPIVKNMEIDGEQCIAILLKNSAGPVATFPINGKKLIITCSEYLPTSIDGVTSDEAVIIDRDGKKYVQGGRLIIVKKDGTKYDIDGTEIK